MALRPAAEAAVGESYPPLVAVVPEMLGDNFSCLENLHKEGVFSTLR